MKNEQTNNKKLVIANWKLHKTTAGVKKWLDQFLAEYQPADAIKIAISPSFPHVAAVRAYKTLDPKGLELAAQDVSRFKHASAHTGEVSAVQLADLGVKYVIIGHSERRRDFGETNENINEKIARCLENGLQPVVCVRNLTEADALIPIPNTQPLTIAYEPLEAIGSGQPASPAETQKMALAIKGILGENTRVLYGGSADSSNVTNYTNLDGVNGVLVGSASLDSMGFSKLVKAVSNY